MALGHPLQRGKLVGAEGKIVDEGIVVEEWDQELRGHGSPSISAAVLSR
jgi:hypothetical protein